MLCIRIFDCLLIPHSVAGVAVTKAFKASFKGHLCSIASTQSVSKFPLPRIGSIKTTISGYSFFLATVCSVTGMGNPAFLNSFCTWLNESCGSSSLSDTSKTALTFCRYDSDTSRSVLSLDPNAPDHLQIQPETTIRSRGAQSIYLEAFYLLHPHKESARAGHTRPIQPSSSDLYVFFNRISKSISVKMAHLSLTLFEDSTHNRKFFWCFLGKSSCSVNAFTAMR